ncbi:uncharacterized protein LOC114667607 [Erpetoichthys calabaricus]|uniref:uncharacterized protein LOC114667607 n=1 Tax=Erpetoichthys calabaricus TaxID=27687 RepID=UPI0010A07EA5|nr:uncharacterized protein LOC114667607 [Erpetoichthys calabaricus]
MHFKMILLVLWFFWSRAGQDNALPSYRFIECAAQRFAVNRAARTRRFLRRQMMLREEFAAFLANYNSRSSVRSIWMRQRCGVWWEHVLTSWTDCEWKENFRMRKTTFLKLCNILHPHLHRETTTFRKAVPVVQRVAICVWRLATNVEFRTISHLFGTGQSTAVTIANHVSSIIVEKLLSVYIKTPSEHDFRNIIQGFRDQWGFPQCGGAIDGTHIGILAPPEIPADYHNPKGFYSVILQGVVDHRLCFWDINVGWPGKVHNARVFGNSSLYERGQSGMLFPNITERFGGIDVPVVMLGDTAYPLLPWLMKPYPENQQMTPAQITFNNRLGKARMTVERAFGRLKGRWRCLRKRYDCHINNINNIIAACCILHNFCEINNEEYDDIDVHEENETHELSPYQANAIASASRDALCLYFSNL